ncbi:MAG: uroporphyrinogen-III C-methyltransferase [Tannerellaceae bacterium]|nr:uroporphyrinogen-III C-methyltransferase [Tannerellaceae bacterium]
MEPGKIRVISRKSRLALLQVEEILSLLPPHITTEKIEISSWGDSHKEVSLLENPPADIFTRELDEAILNNRADIAIHSAKDLPFPLPQGLTVVAVTGGLTGSDSLVSRNHILLDKLPEGARIRTSSPTRKKELLKLRPGLQVVSIRGTIEERLALVDNHTIDALIVATCALERLGLQDRITQILPFETHPLQGHLAVTAQEDNKFIKELFAPLDSRRQYGQVTLVGFGPGNPDLLTLAGEKAIKQADIIFYDDLIEKNYLLSFEKELVYVGKRSGRHHVEQDTINRMLLESARHGKQVVRLKGGDPMIFAHAAEEISFLESNFIQVQVIPGITTASALAASTGISLTHRDIASSVAFVLGHGEKVQTPTADTLVYYMGARNNRHIANELITAGRAPQTPVLLVHNVSAANQQEFYSTLEELSREEKQFPTPLIILIGEVVKKRLSIKNKKKILYTGSVFPEHKLRGDYIHTPLIQIDEVDPKSVLPELTGSLSSMNYLLFTSRYAVRYFFRIFHKTGKDSRALHHLKIAAIGKTTAQELFKYGINADIIPTQEDSYGVIEAFKKEIPGKILIPRSDKALSIIPEGLQKIGYTVKTITIYRNTQPPYVTKVDLKKVSAIELTSPSGVKRFHKLYGSFPEDKEYILKGAITQQAFNQLQTINSDETVQTIQA